jgi:hypothetical protein
MNVMKKTLRFSQLLILVLICSLNACTINRYSQVYFHNRPSAGPAVTSTTGQAAISNATAAPGNTVTAETALLADNTPKVSASMRAELIKRKKKTCPSTNSATGKKIRHHRGKIELV